MNPQKEKIGVIISGLPGNMALLTARTIEESGQFELFPVGLTGSDPDEGIEKTITVGADEKEIILFSPEERSNFLCSLNKERAYYNHVLVLDFTHPSAILENVLFYCENGLPFVMGTTGGDRLKLAEIVGSSRISAVLVDCSCLDALSFLLSQVKERSAGRVFSMVDVKAG